MRARVRDMIRRPLNALGFELVRTPVDPPRPGNRLWKDRLLLAKGLGFSPAVILDGGAFKGLWSKQAASLFPAAQMILVEPNPFVQEIIRSNVAGIVPAPVIMNCALGEAPARGQLNIWRDAESDPGASLLEHVSGKAGQIVDVEVETLDNIAERLGLVPDLLKLDLQGGELAALKGGTRVLRQAEMAIIEFGCLEAYVDRTTPRQLLDLMYESDYCLYDIASLNDRPHDGALTGGDFFFVKNSSQLRRHKGWE
jgi:FkbM family methyltransferase